MTTPTEIRRGPAITTVSGGKFHPLDPTPEEIKIEDMAVALSHVARFSGHTKFHYSVAQHCVLGAKLIKKQNKDAQPAAIVKLQLAFLLHDASEAYIADVSRPVKELPGSVEYLQVEQRIQAVINQKFGLDVHAHVDPRVVLADNTMLVTEGYKFFTPEIVREWKMKEQPDPETRVVPWVPEYTQRMFLDAFGSYYGGT